MHLFFDLDNTLWDFDVNSKKVLAQLFIELQLEQKLNTSFESFYIFYKNKNDELWHLYYANEIKKSELRHKRFYDTFNNFNCKDELLSNKMAEEYVRISPYSKALKPGCIEMLTGLSKKHQLHIITNGFKEIQRIKMETCGLSPFFKEIIISEEHGFTKPDIRIFELAAKKANANQDECVMIGDNWVADVEGAIGAGWKAVFYQVSERALFEHKNLTTIKHLNELTNLF